MMLSTSCRYLHCDPSLVASMAVPLGIGTTSTLTSHPHCILIRAPVCCFCGYIIRRRTSTDLPWSFPAPKSTQRTTASNCAATASLLPWNPILRDNEAPMAFKVEFFQHPGIPTYYRWKCAATAELQGGLDLSSICVFSAFGHFCWSLGPLFSQQQWCRHRLL